MESLVGLILVNIFLFKLNNGLLQDILSKVYNYCLCVDNTFIVCRKMINQEDIPNTFNNKHPLVQFTCEEYTFIAFYLANIK